jgi:hypothetical protein
MISISPAELDHLLASAQFFLRMGSVFNHSLTDWVNKIAEFRKANTEALVSDLIPIIEDTVKINQPIVARITAAVKKHAK